MNKRKKVLLAAACLLLTALLLWAAVFLTDFICVSKARAPVFAKLVTIGYNSLFEGPGYTVEVLRHGYTGPIEQITMYSLSGRVLNAVIICHSIS